VLRELVVVAQELELRAEGPVQADRPPEKRREKQRQKQPEERRQEGRPQEAAV
jgi:hypothetical protein